MWFSLFSVVLVLCIAYFQVIQGLFSGVIMCVLTVLCAALAFGTYENLYYGFLIDRMPDHGEAVALLSIFIISLLVLRTAADAGIPGNMVFPVWVERIGGGALGLVTALVMVGMIQIGFQLLPFSNTFLGFNRFAPVDNRGSVIDDDRLKKLKPDEVEWPRQNLMLSPDEFTIRLVSTLSSGALSGNQAFRDVYPDFAATLQDTRTAVQRESRHAVTDIQQGITLQDKGYWILESNRLDRLIKDKDPKTGADIEKTAPALIPPGDELRVYRVKLSSDVKDTDSNFRFRAPQVRIVGRDRPGGPPTQYILKGIDRAPPPSNAQPGVQPAKTVRPPTGGTQYLELFRDPVTEKHEVSNVVRAGDTFDFVFAVPKTFQARFIEFKRTARVDVSNHRKIDKPVEKPTAAPRNSSRDRAPGQGSQPPDGSTQTPPPEATNRIHGVWLGKKAPEFRDRLPIKLAGNVGGAQIENGKLVGGRFFLPVQEENLTQDDSQRLQVAVPENERLLFVTVTELDPKSYLGKARGFAQRALPTVTLKLEGGKEIKPAGKYAFARFDGQWWFECIFLDQTARDADKDVPIFDKIKHDQLTQDDSVYVYLFMVPVGAKPVELARAKAEGIPLKSYNLEAK